MSTDTNTKRNPGRPPVTVNWPEGGFTVQQLQVSTGLSKVTLYQKVNEALADHVIQEFTKEKTQQGRPRIVFKKTADIVTTTITIGADKVTTETSSTPVPSLVPA